MKLKDNYQDLLKEWHKSECDLLCYMFTGGLKSEASECMQSFSLKDFRNFPKHYQAILRIKINDESWVSVLGDMKIEMDTIMSEALPRSFSDCVSNLKKVAKATQVFEAIEPLMYELNNENSDELMAKIQQKLSEISSTGEVEKVNIKDIVDDYSRIQEINRLKGDKILGISTGFPKLDSVIDGIRAPHLWVIGGYTSAGKSSLAINLILSILRGEKKVALYSLEMSKLDLVSRLLALMTHEKGIEIMKGKTDDRIENAKKELAFSNLKIINQRVDLHQILLSIHEQKLVWGSDVVVIDYLQQINVKDSKTEYERMTESARELQRIAEKLNIAIIAVSQISNESARSQNSNLMGFKGSGTIASAADFALELVPDETDAELYRQKIMNNEPVSVKAVIKKNRHGRTGMIRMKFYGAIGKFEEEKEIVTVEDINNNGGDF